LLIMLITLLLLVSEIDQTTIQVVIVIPLELEPYIDWWLNFPGWHQLDEQLPNLQTWNLTFSKPNMLKSGTENIITHIIQS
jgi:hypothetical protein